MSQITEGLRIGQFYPVDEECVYVLYDGPDDWALRIGFDASVKIGRDAVVRGVFPNYRVEVPSGMSSSITEASVVVFTEGVHAGKTFPLSEALRGALTFGPAGVSGEGSRDD